MRRFMFIFGGFFIKLLWKLRYRVTFKGLEEVKQALKDSKDGVLFLPNHPAVFIDPMLVAVPLLQSFEVRPLIIEYMYYNPFVNWFARFVRAIAIPNFYTSYNLIKKRRTDVILRKMSEGLKNGERFIIYPSGGTKKTGKEVLGGAFGAYQLVHENPETQIVLIRMTGLWGSSFSRALTHGDPPDMMAMIKKACWTLLKNGIFFTPRREVTVEFEMAPRNLPKMTGKIDFNRYLEEWYNRPFEKNGENLGEPLSLVSYSIFYEALPTIKERMEDHLEMTNVPHLIKEQVLTKLAEMANLPKEKILPSHQLIADLGFDSIELAEILTFLDENFHIQNIHPADLTTVSRLFLIAMKLYVGPEAKDPDFDLKQWKKPLKHIVGLPEGETIPEVFFRMCDKQLFHSMIADPRAGVITYRTLKMRVLLLAEKIRKLPGKRVGILLPSSIGVQAIILACQCAGKTPVMINWTIGGRHLSTVLETSEIEVVLTSWVFLDNLENGDIGPLDEKIILLEELKNEISLKSVLKAEYLSYLSADTILHRPEFSHLVMNGGKQEAVILFTSGTEAAPKGVPLTHDNILSDQRASLQSIELLSTDVMLSFLPPFHSFGFVLTGLLPLLAGVRVIYYPSPLESKRLAKAISKWQATILPGAPTFLKNIFQVSYREQLATLRLVVSGAERAPQEFFDMARKLCPKAKIMEGYGITECSPLLSINTLGVSELGVGKAIPCVQFSIVHHEEMTPLPLGEVGLILACGPNVFSGYLNSTKNPFVDIKGSRWYITGDLGKLDRDGNLIISGRLKRFVKIGGEMISLASIEEVVDNLILKKALESPEGPKIAVCSKEENGERPRLTLFTTVPLELQEVNNTLREQGLSSLAKVDKICQLERIPVLATGKISYRALDQMVIT